MSSAWGLLSIASDGAADTPEDEDDGERDERDQRDVEQDDPGILASAAERNDAGDERELKAFERIARFSGDLLGLGEHAAGNPGCAAGDEGDATVRRDDEELVVVDVMSGRVLDR